jgi:hypothetical protein
MRTTVELPPDLLRTAKARSAERGESLKSLLARAVAAELGRSAGDASPQPRVRLPLFGGAAGARADLSNADLERVLGEADARRGSGRTVRGRARPARRRKQR